MANLEKLKKLTIERFEQMIETFSLREIEDIVDEWGFDQVNKGYAVFDYDGTGMLGIEAIGDVGAFDGDDEATQQAVKDGYKIIPIAELPKKFPYKWFGWIDTPENRKAIDDYMERRVK